jgi:hypothetical protein
MSKFLFSVGTLLGLGIWLLSCESSTDPFDVGGSTDLELTEVGNTFPVTIEANGSWALDAHIRDTTLVINRGNGIVTFQGRYHIDSVGFAMLDTLLGIQAVPLDIKRAALDYYLRKLGATIDSSNKNDIVVRITFQLKVTSDGIAEFFSSKGDVSRPRAMVKYSWNVGDQIRFTDDDGVTITRKVVLKSTEDDYPIAFWLVKTIDVEQTAENSPFSNIVQRLVIIGNHKFGLVGLKLYTATGKEIHITIFPPTLR